MQREVMSFLAASYQHSAWTQLQQQLSSSLDGVILQLSLSSLPQQTFTQMQVIAREAHVTRTEHKVLAADMKAITADLGPNVDVSLDGGAPRDPLVAYYNGQVVNFVHRR